MVDGAGNRMAQARDLGRVGDRQQTLRDGVGPSDRNDVYRLRLAYRSTLHLQIDRLQANADLQLLNRQGQVLQTASRPGPRAETMRRGLPPGTYYVRIVQRQGQTDYRLKISAPLQIPRGNAPVGDRWLYQLQNASIRDINASTFNLVTIDYSRDGSDTQRYRPIDLAALHRRGKTALAYLSIGEAEDYRDYFQSGWLAQDRASGLQQPSPSAPTWLGHTNPDWAGNYKVRYWAKDWQQIVLSYVDNIIDAGFDGVYLDIIDAFEYWSDRRNGEGFYLKPATAAQRMISFVETIAYHARVERGQQNFYILPQNGEIILAYDADQSYLHTISGIGVEDLFYDELQPQPAAEIAYRLRWLNRISRRNKAVLSVDYVDRGTGYRGSNQARIDSFRQQAIAHSYRSYVARRDRALDTINRISGLQE